MMRQCFTLLALLAVAASAFTTPQTPFGGVKKMTAASTSSSSNKPLFMFSSDDDNNKKSSLSEVAPGESTDALDSAMQSSSEEEDPFKRPPPKTMTVQSRNTGEIYEVEMNESFMANSMPFEMSWWAWIGFVIFPVTMLSNDVFHFLPTDGPLGFLGRI